MADEITGVGELQPDGTERARLLYVFPIVPRVVDGDGVEVVPAFDAADIPDYFASRQSVAVLQAIADGDAGWVIRSLDKSIGETDLEFIARSKKDYDGLTAYTLAQRRDEAVETNEYDRRRFQVDR